jgi:hypothetical protein
MPVSIKSFHKTNLKEINALYTVLLNSINNENIIIKPVHHIDFYQDFVRYMFHNSIQKNERM